MIDKEIAEEYIKDNCERWVRDCLSAEDIAKENFIAGLKAGSQLDMIWHDYDAGEDAYEDTYEGRWVKREDGKPKWHDLRKNPNDLPDTDRNVWVKRESEIECQIDNYYEDDKGWGIMFREGYCTDDVIAWCELPTFDKE